MPAIRCINIDWLEVYCIEPAPRDIDYFVGAGHVVQDRGYGTKQWQEMFTIMDASGDPFMEVRRKPRVNSTGSHTFMPDNACHLRFVNRYCYFNSAPCLMMEFIERYGYQFQKIYRIDLCLDLERFDSGDLPRDVVRRIVTHKYAKVYQADRTTHGYDRWDGCDDNSLSWGNKRSMIITRLYNKSKELEDAGWKKPWIVQAWFEAGLIDNPITRTRVDKDGQTYTPTIWRLEFQINAQAKRWVELDTAEGKHYLENTLDAYATPQGLVMSFSCLAQHYFSFRKYKKGARKYDCKEKILFNFSFEDGRYKLVNTAIDRVYNEHTALVIKQLVRMKTLVADGEALEALDVLINYFSRVQLDDFTYGGLSDKILKIKLALAPQSKDMSVEQLKDLARTLF